MKKNDVIELLNTLKTENDALVTATTEQMNNAQSADESKALERVVSKHKTKAKYIARLVQSDAIADAVASQAVQLKFSADQIKDVCNDSYSLAKFAPMMIALVQKRKVSSGDEHVLSEFLAVVASGANDLTFEQFGAKMQNRKNESYGARQPQMCCKLLERLNAVSYKKISGNKSAIHFEHESALGKRLMKAYE